MKYYIADLHFGDENSISFCNRPFSSVTEMDETLIKNWNETVKDQDDVFIIGDVAFHNKIPVEEYLYQLNGKLHLISGNHDYQLLKNEKALKCFESVYQIGRISDRKTPVILCHYPMAEWPDFYRGAYHIYGHIHNILDQTMYHMIKFEKALNAGVEITGYRPVTLKECIKLNEKFKNNIKK